jgi:hypothetical protein
MERAVPAFDAKMPNVDLLIGHKHGGVSNPAADVVLSALLHCCHSCLHDQPRDQRKHLPHSSLYHAILMILQRCQTQCTRRSSVCCQQTDAAAAPPPNQFTASCHSAPYHAERTTPPQPACTNLTSPKPHNSCALSFRLHLWLHRHACKLCAGLPDLR